MKRSISRMFLVVVVVGLLLVATAAPAFAFIHVTVPAGECAASDQAGDNPTAGVAIRDKNPPVGDAQGAAKSEPQC